MQGANFRPPDPGPLPYLPPSHRILTGHFKSMSCTSVTLFQLNDLHNQSRALHTIASTPMATDVAPLHTSTHGQFKGVHVLRTDVDFRVAGWATTPLAIGSFAAGALKSRLLPTKYAPWKDRGVGKGHLRQMSPISRDLCSGAAALLRRRELDRLLVSLPSS